MGPMCKLPNIDGQTAQWVNGRNVGWVERVPDAEVIAMGGTPPWSRVYFVAAPPGVVSVTCALDEDQAAQEINNQAGP